MSVSTKNIRCTRPECNIAVATGTVTDNMFVYEITLDDSVTQASALSVGMLVGDWRHAKVTHTVAEHGTVTHTIHN